MLAGSHWLSRLRKVRATGANIFALLGPEMTLARLQSDAGKGFYQIIIYLIELKGRGGLRPFAPPLVRHCPLFNIVNTLVGAGADWYII